VTNEIQQNRYDQTMRRVTGIIGPGSKVAEVLTELFPVIDLERVPGELLILGGTDICLGAASAQGGAGDQANVTLFNPLDSGKIITVSLIYATTPSIQTIRVAIASGAVGTRTNTERFRDTRRGFAARPVGQIATELAGTITTPNLQLRTVANAQIEIEDENSLAVLAPGSRLEVGTDTAATLILVNFFWRERAAQPAELSI